MNLIQLRYFQAVCACGNLTQAAQQLHISQPSLSSAIQSLEKEFGVGLFVRQYRGVELTAEGEQLLKLSRSLTENADKLVRIMQDLGAGRHILRLGVPPVLGGWLLPRLYTDFFRHHEEISLEVMEKRRAVIKEELEHELLDLAFIIHTQPVYSGFEALFVTDLESGALVCRNHPLAGKKVLPLANLSAEKLVLMPELFFQSELVEGRFRKAGQEPQILCRTSQLYTMIQLVKNDGAMGVGYKEMFLDDPDLCFLPFEEPLKIHLSLIWKKHQYASEGMKQLIAFLKNGKDCS